MALNPLEQALQDGVAPDDRKTSKTLLAKSKITRLLLGDELNNTARLAAFENVLNQNVAAKAIWDTAIYIDISDPITMQLLPVIAMIMQVDPTDQVAVGAMLKLVYADAILL